MTRIAVTAAVAAALAAACASTPPEAPVPPFPTPTPAPIRPAAQAPPDSVTRLTTGRVEAGERVLETAEGEATYYAERFDGRRTASGVMFRNAEAWAAHRTYPFGTIVRVTNLANDRSVIVRIVDRGPHGTSERARRTIIDLSRSAASDLDFIRAGRVPVRVEVLEWGTSGRESLQSARRYR
jgi:rare lipoprotein A